MDDQVSRFTTLSHIGIIDEERNSGREAVMTDITEEDRQAAKRMILAYNLNPSDEDKIAARIAEMNADGNVGRFLEYLRELGAKVDTKLPLD